MITLYEFHWSHYCEKIRLVLDVANLEWERVGIDAFSKRELVKYERPLHLPKMTVPAIFDKNKNQFVIDSTPIVRYLANHYPAVERLYGTDPKTRLEVDKRLLEFDGLLAIGARRFGYTQVILECPELLPTLFMSHRAGGLYCRPLIRRIAGAAMGILLSKRFDFHRCEQVGLWSAMESYLLGLSSQLEGRKFIVGNTLTVADLAFAAQIRPLTIVPFFAENENLKSLFLRHREVLRAYGREPDSAYQVAIMEKRLRNAPVRRRILQRTVTVHFKSNDSMAANDHQELWDRHMLLMPYHYFVTLRKGTRRLASATLNYR